MPTGTRTPGLRTSPRSCPGRDYGLLAVEQRAKKPARPGAAAPLKQEPAGLRRQGASSPTRTGLRRSGDQRRPVRSEPRASQWKWKGPARSIARGRVASQPNSRTARARTSIRTMTPVVARRARSRNLAGTSNFRRSLLWPLRSQRDRVIGLCEISNRESAHRVPLGLQPRKGPGGRVRDNRRPGGCAQRLRRWEFWRFGRLGGFRSRVGGLRGGKQGLRGGKGCGTVSGRAADSPRPSKAARPDRTSLGHPSSSPVGAGGRPRGR